MGKANGVHFVSRVHGSGLKLRDNFLGVSGGQNNRMEGEDCEGLALKVQGLGFRVSGLRFRVEVSGPKVQA